ncbi:MAG TPA: tetratricopeptide repeat protein, partial [Terriglobales bacterium]|nr:tetratricopeptide repeat protein [Terriglobales bacterium]
KCVQQGKLQNAITEYEKILKADPKDLTVMNTVGDLHARLGENEKAAECFRSVGDAYASQGFTVKAIAMYKKLSKLKSSTDCVLRLAELYTQQGLFNDARAQYLQVAEDFLRSGQLDQAVKIFEKTLEMDPDNVAMRTKLAEVYVRMGKKPEAWKILTAAAENLRAKGQLAAADEILQRMLKLEPGNSYALVLRGRAALDAGDAAAAITALTKVSDLDSNLEGLRALFQAYLRSKNYSEAGTLAAKLVNVHDEGSAITEYSDALMEGQRYREALQVFEENADRLLKNDGAKLIESLRSIVGYVKEDTQALEAVLALYQKAGDTTHLTEIYELLAHAFVQGNDLEKAREYYQILMQLEPANPMHAKNYQQVAEKQGAANVQHLITPEEGSVLLEELEATAPFLEQKNDDEALQAVRAAMTDAELFISYNMPAKALEPLISVLPKAPRDLRVNQKLAALHTRAGKFAEAAACCRTLESIYQDANHPDEAARYGDLAAKYEQRSGGAASPASALPVAAHNAHAPEFEISAPLLEVPEHEGHAAAPGASETHPAPVAARPEPVVSATPSGVFFHVPGSAAPASQQSSQAAETAKSEAPVGPVARVHAEAPTIDGMSEWEDHLEVQAPTTAPPEEAVEEPQQSKVLPASAAGITASAPEVEINPSRDTQIEDSIEEVRFYLGQGMIDQADVVLRRLEAKSPDSAELAMLRVGVDSAKQQPPAPAPEAEIAIEEPAPAEAEEPVIEAVQEQPRTVSATSTMTQPWPQTRPAAAEAPQVPREKTPPEQRPVLQELVSDLEESLGDDFLTAEGPQPEAARPEVHAPIPAAPEPAGGHPYASGQEFRSNSLDDFVSDLEASFGTEPAAPPEQPAARANAPLAHAAVAAATGPVAHASTIPVAPRQSRAPQAPAAPLSGAGVDLADIFGELKQELEGEPVSADEDPETHYNLGVAFREMGLLDEAIGEFQKVTQAAEHGHAFSQLMQTYTWLAQCFLDKGIPQAAVRWYETALKVQGIDQETRTALHYELASSWESAGNRAAALNNFLEVYSSNIDYRDVGERIKALRS